MLSIGDTVLYQGGNYRITRILVESCGRKAYEITSIDRSNIRGFRYDHELELVCKTPKTVGADRYNEGKPQLSLIDPNILYALARVLEFGCTKYEIDNWKKGQERKKIMDSLLRHTVALMSGENKDPESGLSHGAHIAANIMFHEYYMKEGMYG